jgi:hypothetical protein
LRIPESSGYAQILMLAGDVYFPAIGQFGTCLTKATRRPQLVLAIIVTDAKFQMSLDLIRVEIVLDGDFEERVCGKRRVSENRHVRRAMSNIKVVSDTLH